MAHHHGMNELEGMPAFCHYGHEHQRGDRFGRMFNLAPLYTPAEDLRSLGAPGGPMDGGTGTDRTDSVPVGQIFFGQFVDHDITLDVTSSLSGVSSAGETPNVRTPTLDLDSIYGGGPESTPFLYRQAGRFPGAELLTGAHGTAASIDDNGSTVPQPPGLAQYDLWRSPDGTAVIGDPRNDENRVISQMQLAMIRFHNGILHTLADEGLHGETFEGEELFEEAQKLARWHYQWVILHEFLPHMCGKAMVSRILGNGRQFYCPSAKDLPFIPIEFAVAAYRFGHSMIPQRVQIQKNGSSLEVFGRTLGRGFTPLDNTDAVVDWHELTETEENRVVQMAEKLDRALASDLLDLPFIQTGESSLATRNLLRGQAFMLPSGEQVARAMGRDETEVEQVSDAAQSIASDVDLSSGTPLWFYLLVEAEQIGREQEENVFQEGEGLGPVGARIVGETIVGLIELDPRSFLARDRSWNPVSDGIGVQTLGEMLTFKQVPAHA